MDTTTAIKSITFDGETYQTRHLAARIAQSKEANPQAYDQYYNDLTDADHARTALIDMAVRRRFGRTAWVHSLRRDSWSEDGSRVNYEVTVCFGPWSNDGTPCDSMWLTVDADEVAAAARAVAAV